MTRVLIRKRGRQESQREGDGMMGAYVGVMWGHEPRNVGGF